MLIQWYEYSGVTGVSLWVLMVNIGVYFLVRNTWLKKESWRIQAPILLLLSFMLFIPILSSLLIYFTYEEKNDPA